MYRNAEKDLQALDIVFSGRKATGSLSVPVMSFLDHQRRLIKAMIIYDRYLAKEKAMEELDP
jgi:hypothetical protein